jgi:hypothetical protein
LYTPEITGSALRAGASHTKTIASRDALLRGFFTKTSPFRFS